MGSATTICMSWLFLQAMSKALYPRALCPADERSASDRLVAGRRLGYRGPTPLLRKPPFVGSPAMTVATATRPLSPLDHERAMSEYGRRAESRAYALGNRGP